ncbi:MAG: amidohydrolase family protein, partial [Thermoplasmata archaeon]
AAPRSGDAAAALKGAGAFKAYMAESTGGLQIGVPDLDGILRESERQRKLTAVHAEDPSKFTKGPARSLQDHSAIRPKESETSALSILRRIRGDAPLHVAHVTCLEALDAVPPGATCEVTPHHLFLDWSKPLGTRGKVNPPLRSREDREALWEAFRKGRVDVVASDHAPHTLEEKAAPFEESPAGLPGVGTSFPLLMRRTKAGDIDLARLVSALASRPAQILGIPKGVIEVGRDADLIAVDPRATERIRAERLRYKCGWTPFEGMEACFPKTVYVRGEAVVEDGEPAAEGRGRLVSPST